MIDTQHYRAILEARRSELTARLHEIDEAREGHQTSDWEARAGGGAGDKSNAATGAAESEQRSSNMGYNERYEEVQRVPTKALKTLARGEAIVSTDGGKLFHIKVPRVTFSKQFMDAVGGYQVNRLSHQYRKGLNLFDIFGQQV